MVKDSLPRPIFWLAMSAPAESTYVPLAVASLPEAYAKNDRAKYDPAKAWWISQQVTTLTKGYYSAMAPKVLEWLRLRPASRKRTLHKPCAVTRTVSLRTGAGCTENFWQSMTAAKDWSMTRRSSPRRTRY